MKTADFLRQHNACRDGAKWALSVSPNMSAVWDELVKQGKHEWLLWTVTRPGVFPDSTLRKLACRFVRETPLHDGRTVWNLLEDERSRNAIEVAELYADGKATADELYAARAAATWASYAAASDAAFLAAYADAWSAASYAASAAASAAADAAYAAAYDAAYDAQIQMIAELGNPFKKGSDK